MAGIVANAQVHGNSLSEQWVMNNNQGILTNVTLGGRAYRQVLSLILGIYCSVVSGHYTSAQSPQAKKLYEQGLTLFRERKATEAIAFMEQATKEDPTFTDAYLKLGQLYEFIRKPEQALATYRTVVRLQPNPALSGGAYQSLGNILLRMGQYTEAIPVLEQFRTRYADASAGAKRIDRLLATARFGQEALKNPQPVSPKPLSESLNTTRSQYFPVLTADEQTLVFTALKLEGDEDLMTATQTGEGWGAPTSLSPNINTADNEGTATLSADGRTLVFTACQNPRGVGGCDLYISYKTGDSWSTSRNLGPTINTYHYESQPSLTADGRRLYFVSDRPGGRGELDIWRTDLDATGNWASPVNLGAPINTPFNEASPFIHANGQVLFFASQGHVGMGGYDLFVADSIAKGWSVPTNLGYPINTAEDQASLFVGASGTRAYYSYEEQKEGVSQKSRIYTFDLPESLRDRVKPVSYLKGIIVDARTKKPLLATVELIDIATNQVISRVQSDGETGQYTAVLPTRGEYALYVNVPGYLFKSLSFDFAQKTTGDRNAGVGIALPVALEPIIAGGTGKETLNNIFFETARYDIAGKSRTELERLLTFLKTNPAVKIEVAGHTDDRGDGATNLALSQKRAQAVMNFLVAAGVEAGRIRAVGYGKNRPLIPNTTDENRRLNRRIEWRVL